MKKIFAFIILICTAALCFSCQEDPKMRYDDDEINKVITDQLFDTSKEAEDSNIFEIPTILTRNPVLQRDRTIKIWGNTEYEGDVAAVLNGKSYFGKAKDGKFEIYLPPQEAGGPHEMTIRTPDKKAVIKNILFGDVFICSGQSNMEMLLGSCNYPDVIASAANENLRLLVMPRAYNAQPVEDKRVSWVESSPSTASSFSAAGYFFANELQKRLNVPVGIIMAAIGDTTVNVWAPKQEAETMHKTYYQPNNVNRMDSVYYNAMIYPLRHFKIKAVLWYQGENQPVKYDETLAAMIRGWRREFNQYLPFVIVQLPRFYLGDNDAWYTSREMQKRVCSLVEDAYYSVNIDLGIESNELETAIHPPDKELIGVRAAHIALKKLYGFEGVLSGPEYTGYSVSNDKVTIKYTNIGGGLELRNGGRGFEIMDSRGMYYPAMATIEGSNVIITAGIKDIKGFRYAYGAFPEVSLYNKEGYPAEQLKVEIK